MSNKELSQAAEKVAAAEKAKVKAKKPKNPDGNFFVRAGKGIKKFCKDLRGENKKIVWPDRNTVLKSTGVVLVAVAICGLAIFAIDQLLALILSLLERAAESAGKSGADTATTTAAAIMSLSKFILG